MMILSIPIIRFVFQHGAFTYQDTLVTAFTLVLSLRRSIRLVHAGNRVSRLLLHAGYAERRHHRNSRGGHIDSHRLRIHPHIMGPAAPCPRLGPHHYISSLSPHRRAPLDTQEAHRRNRRTPHTDLGRKDVRCIRGHGGNSMGRLQSIGELVPVCRLDRKAWHKAVSQPPSNCLN